MTVESDLRAASRNVQHGAGMLEEATRQRDTLIRQAHAEGASLRTIANWTGLSFGRVAQILKRP